MVLWKKIQKSINELAFVDARSLLKTYEDQPDCSPNFLIAAHASCGHTLKTEQIYDQMVSDYGGESSEILGEGTLLNGLRAKFNLKKYRELTDRINALPPADQALPHVTMMLSDCLVRMGRMDLALACDRRRALSGDETAYLTYIFKLIGQQRHKEIVHFLRDQEETLQETDPALFLRMQLVYCLAVRMREKAYATLELLEKVAVQQVYWEAAKLVAVNYQDTGLGLKVLNGMHAALQQGDTLPMPLLCNAVQNLDFLAGKALFAPLVEAVFAAEATIDNQLYKLKLATWLQDQALAETLSSTSLSLFPESLPICEGVVTTALALGFKDMADAEMRRLQTEFPRETREAVLHDLPPTCWPGDDAPRLLDQLCSPLKGLESLDEFQAVGSAGLSPDIFEANQLERHSAPHALGKLVMEFYARRSKADALLKRSDFQPSLAALVELREESRTILVEAIQNFIDSPAIGAYGVAARNWLRECLQSIARAEEKADHIWTFSSESLHDCLAIAGYLGDRLESGTPTSVIRLGDGEGHLLSALDPWSYSLRHDRAHIMRVWWGDHQVPQDRQVQIANQLVSAIHGADVIGQLPLFQLVEAKLANPGQTMDNRGGLRALQAIQQRVTDIPALVSAHFHQDLEVFDAWTTIFAHRQQASWISCHDLAPVLEQRFDLKTRLSVRTPPENAHAGKFDMTDTAGPLITMHEQVLAQLEPEPGELWLVAAGILGKIYCEHLRAAGAIAIDIGSLADYWVGKITRPYQIGYASDIPQGLFSRLASLATNAADARGQ